MTKDIEILDDRIFSRSNISMQCGTCRHIQSMIDRQCAAFPDGIPDKIWDSIIIHDKPINGDLGIIYERNE